MKDSGGEHKLDVEGFKEERVGNSTIVRADCFDWMKMQGESSIHSIVTDPPYGLVEYEPDHLEKRKNGKGGIWRIPPSFDGHERAPLPRFTALNSKERANLAEFFTEWSKLSFIALRPGAHVIIATSSVVASLLYTSLVSGGLEFRGQLIRLVRTLRGGDRPKNAEAEYPNVTSLLKGVYEPWGIFRKPLPPKMTIGECLRQFKTGGLRWRPDGMPFEDVVQSERTPRREKEIADHPSLKPQSLLRQLVYVSLPLGEGVVVDPFMGSGSTVAAAEHVGYSAIGIEKNPEYYALSKKVIPFLSKMEARDISNFFPSSQNQLGLHSQ